MATTSVSAFLQPHVRRVTIGNGAGTRLLPGTTIGVWCIDSERRRLATSAMYRASSVAGNRRAALTVYETPALALGSYVSRLVGIARVLSTVDHPGVIDVIDVGLTADGRPYSVTDLEDGFMYSEWIAAGKALEVSQKLALLRDICAPLQAAHEAGVVHGGLTPELIMVVDNGDRHVKLLDWGFERAVLDEARRAGIDRPTRVRCSAPEATHGVLSPQTDVYAFGLVAYELLVGKPAFPTGFPTSMRDLQEMGPPDPRVDWPAIPTQLEILLISLLATDPRQRPTIREVAEVLVELDAELAAPCESVPVRTPIPVEEARASDTFDEEDNSETYAVSYRSTWRRKAAPKLAIAATFAAVAFALLAPSILDPDAERVSAPTIAASASATLSPAVVQPLPRVTSSPPTPTPAASVAAPSPSDLGSAVPAKPPVDSTPRTAVAVAPAAARVEVDRTAEPTKPAPVARKPAVRRAPIEVATANETGHDPVSAELLRRYQRIGHDLIQLRRQRTSDALTQLWHEFSALKIHHALANAKTRATAAATLDQLRAKIDRNKAITPSKACLDNPLADGCR